LIKHFLREKKNLYGEKELEDNTWEEFIENETYEAKSNKLYDEAINEAKGSVPDGLEYDKTYSKEEVSEAFKNMDEKRMDVIGQNGNDGLHYDNEFDEEHALDQVLNNMVKDDNDGSDTSEEFIGYSLKSGKRIKKIIKKAHYKTGVVFMDGSTGWVDDVVAHNPKDNPDKIVYL
jgi:hypothetical protein